MKLTSEELSDTAIESLSLSVSLLERFETMQENGLFVTRAKQSLKTTMGFLEAYVEKVLIPASEDEEEHFKRGATVITEMSNRVETALKVENILDISTRKRYLRDFIDTTVLFPAQKDELYETIRDSGILNY